MENLRLLLVITVLCAVLSDGLAQSRGSSRYEPAEELDGASTPSQRSPPSRRQSVRRRKPTPAPEPSEINKELPDYQLPKREGTTGRRVPTRVPTEEFAPHIPDVPVLPDEPILPAVVDELPEITTTAPEDKSQGRRRRPKKRRRPQNAAGKPAADAVKLDVTEPEKSRQPVANPKLLDVDQKRPEPFSANLELINNPNKFDSPPNLEEKPLWSDDKLINTAGDPSQRVPEPVPYYPPQVGTNRLPLEDTERVESARENAEPTPPSYLDVQNKRYSHPAVEPSSRASYVPVLNPIRAPTESRSHLPNEDYTTNRNQESTRRTRPSDRRTPQRTAINRTPSMHLPEVNEERKITGARAPQNFIPHNSQPRIPEKALPEVRLPTTDAPLLANDFTDKPAFETAEELLERLQEEGNPAVEGIDLQGPDTASRLPNPGDSPYDDAYPPYIENIESEKQSNDGVPHLRENMPSIPKASFNDIQPQETPKRQSTNNVDTDGRQISRYEPPLQRGGFGNRGSERSEITRSTSESNSPSQGSTRGRGSSRYQPEAALDESSRTRSTSRSSSDSSSNTPLRTRSSQTPSQTSSRSRNTQRYQPDPAESRARVSTRRQPANPEYTEEHSPDIDYSRRPPAPVDEEEEEQFIPPPPRNVPANVPEEEYIPVRSAVQYRPPQHEAPDTDEPYIREEVPEDQPDPNVHVPEYQAPRQPNHRRPVDQRQTSLRAQPTDPRVPPLREQAVDQRGPPQREQPERHVYRQTNRRENVGHRNVVRQPQPDYRAPEENNRYQPEYQAPPQNSRTHARPLPQRDSYQERQPAPRQQSRSRQPEPSPNQGRASGSSKFKCPEAYGFFADPGQCDKYYECRNGTSVENLCEDGLAFNQVAAPKFLRCDSLRDVDCSSRSELQEAKPTKNCPRRFGLYPHEADCTKFFNCVDGSATEVQCPPGLVFNDDRATCDWADLVKSSCKTEDLVGFTCPEPSAYDLQDGVYTTYPHPDNCQLHFVCIKGDDGLRRPRMLNCNEGLVYNPTSKSCSRPDEVPGCEDFYGSRSPPPKAQRKPAREPVEEEVYEEPPTPKPRRRVQNRRQRN